MPGGASCPWATGECPAADIVSRALTQPGRVCADPRPEDRGPFRGPKKAFSCASLATTSPTRSCAAENQGLRRSLSQFLFMWTEVCEEDSLSKCSPGSTILGKVYVILARQQGPVGKTGIHHRTGEVFVNCSVHGVHRPTVHVGEHLKGYLSAKQVSAESM